MSKKNATAKFLKRRICYYLTSGVVTITMPMAVYAVEQTAEQAPPMEAEFDSVFLIDDAQKSIFLVLNTGTQFCLVNITLTFISMATGLAKEE